MVDHQRIMINHQKTIGRQWLVMVELKRGTFLVLEDIRWGENSGE